MGDTHAVEDYGWRDAGHTDSHRYLEPAVLSWLGRLGARRVLDLGCGNRALCRTLKDAGYEVVGCDADRRGIELARSRSPDIRFEVVEIGSPPEVLGEASFDVVVSTEVVEHLYNPPDVARIRVSTGEGRRTSDRDDTVSWVSEEFVTGPARSLGFAPCALVGRRAHQVLVACDANRAAGARRFPGGRILGCGQDSTAVEEHGARCTEALIAPGPVERVLPCRPVLGQ